MLCWSSGSWETMSPVNTAKEVAEMFKNECMEAKAESPRSAVVSHKKSPQRDAGKEALLAVVCKSTFVVSARQHML